MADPIARLIRLRAAEADAARRDLATALRAHDAAETRVSTSQRALVQEAEAAPADAAHPLIGAYAIWLPSGQAAIARARAEAATSLAGVDVARAALASARVAVRACESVAETQAAARRKTLLQKQQIVLEDSVRRAGLS